MRPARRCWNMRSPAEQEPGDVCCHAHAAQNSRFLLDAGARLCSGVRNLARVDVDLSEGATALFGANGSGKTSFLEAIHLLGTGRSFRARHAKSIIQHSHATCRVVEKSVGARDRSLLVLRKTGTPDCGPALVGKRLLKVRACSGVAHSAPRYGQHQPVDGGAGRPNGCLTAHCSTWNRVLALWRRYMSGR